MGGSKIGFMHACPIIFSCGAGARLRRINPPSSQLILIPGGVSFMLYRGLIRALGLTCCRNRNAEILLRPFYTVRPLLLDWRACKV
jgi:hypothetical protein